MSHLNRDFQWAIRDKQSLLRARFLHLIMKHAWSGNRTTDQRHAKCNMFAHKYLYFKLDMEYFFILNKLYTILSSSLNKIGLQCE